MKDEVAVAAKELDYSQSLGLLDYLDPYNNDPYSRVNDNINEQQYYMNPMHCTITNKQNSSLGDTRIGGVQCTEFSAISSFSSSSSNSEMGYSKGARWTQPEKFPVEVGIVQHRETTDIGVCFSRENLTVGCDSNNPITLDEQSTSASMCTTATTTTSATSGGHVVEMISEEEKSPEFAVSSGGGDGNDRTGESEMLETLITAMHENNENSNNSENDKNKATNEPKIAHETTHKPFSETSKQPDISEISNKEQFLDGISAAFSSECTAPPENVVDVALPSWMEDIKAKMDGAGYSKAGTQEKCTCGDSNGEGQSTELSEGRKGCAKCSANQNTTARNRRKNKRKKELAAKGLSMCLNDFIGDPAKKPCSDKMTTNNKSDNAYTDVSMEGCNVDGTTNAKVSTQSSVTAISTDASVSIDPVNPLVNDSGRDPMKSSVTGDDEVTTSVSDQFVVQQEVYVADVAAAEHDNTNYAISTREYTNLSDPREVLVARNEFTTSTTTTTTRKDNHLRGCLWSPDGRSVLTNSDDNVLRLFNIPDDVADASCGEELGAAVRMQEGKCESCSS